MFNSSFLLWTLARNKQEQFCEHAKSQQEMNSIEHFKQPQQLNITNNDNKTSNPISP